MQVQITITNPSFDALLALAMAMHGTTTFGVYYDAEGGEVRQDDAPTQAQDAVAEAVSTVYPDWLEVGALVHWYGQIFDFDGVVERFEPSDDPDAKVVWVRRSDTDKLVSLTLSDLRSGGLAQRIADTPAVADRIVSVDDIYNRLDIDTEVHWRGEKFEFDGVVERIDDEVVSPDAGLEYLDDKAVFIRRNDTGKLVSLTLRDLQTGSLTLK